MKNRNLNFKLLLMFLSLTILALGCSDNVFDVTGNWSTTFSNGNTHAYEILLPLRREVICFFFVSGSIDVERTNFSGVFDYDNGDCYNMATFTFANGNLVDVVLN